MKKALFRKISISLTILIIGIICFSFFKLISWYVNSSRKIDDTDTEAIVKYHILVAGSSENETFIRQVYSGAAQRATSYSAAVQLYIPQNSFGETTVQDIFDYASFLEPDGIIICFDDIPKNALTPCYKDGSNIPVITTGQYYSDWPQVSFIGVNYSELGNVFAQEIISSLKSEDDSVLLIDSSNTNDANYSVLMNTLMNTLTEKKVNVQSLSFSPESTFSIEDDIRQSIASANETNLIVSVTEATTVHAAQSIIDLNLANKTKLIGYSGADNSRLYYNKGILTTMISIDSEEIGRKAVNELFEYITFGSANGYVNADIQIRRQSKRK